MKILSWLKKIPGWIWVALVATGLLVASAIGWRRAATRCAAALERAKSAETSLAIEREASDGHAKVAEDLRRDVTEIDDRAEAELAELDGRAEAIEEAEDDADGSLADLANKHFENEG